MGYKYEEPPGLRPYWMTLTGTLLWLFVIALLFFTVFYIVKCSKDEEKAEKQRIEDMNDPIKVQEMNISNAVKNGQKILLRAELNSEQAALFIPSDLNNSRGRPISTWTMYVRDKVRIRVYDLNSNLIEETNCGDPLDLSKPLVYKIISCNDSNLVTIVGQ